MIRVLVVEDDVHLCQTIVQSLQLQGHEVDWATSTQEALTLAQGKRLDLLINDIRIAGDSDGVEAFELIRKQQPWVRCILMTGFSDVDAPRRAAILQADDYLLKPFKLQTLLRSLQNALDRRFSQTPPVLRALEPEPGQALAWLFDESLQLLETQREMAIHQYYLLVKSGRLSLVDAHALFSIWETLELDYLHHPGPENWARLGYGYRHWEQALTLLKIPHKTSENISQAQFALLYARIQSGVVQSRQLLQSIRLLHDLDARRESLHHYCTYHWLWSHQLDEGDPFLGLVVGGYRLLRHRSTPSSTVRLYEAASGELILCAPREPAWENLVARELESQRAQLLEQSFDHQFLLYQSRAFSLQARLPGQGVNYRQAWKILRPIFQQVAGFHQRHRFSGCFSLQDIDSPPGQACFLHHFSEAAYCQRHQRLQRGEAIDSLAAPEVLWQPRPGPASDQAVLGRLLFEVVHGGQYPDASLQIHLQLLGKPGANQAFAPHLQGLGPFRSVFYRMAQADPGLRYPHLTEAIQALDALCQSA